MASSSPGAPIHTLLAKSGDYSDVEVDSDNSAMEDDDYEMSASTDPKDWLQQSRSKGSKRQSQQSDEQKQSDAKKSKIDSAGTSTIKQDESEMSYVVYLRGQTTKLTSKNPLTVCQDIKKTFGPVQKVERRGISLKVYCFSAKQRDVILACSELGGVSISSSLPYSEIRKLQNDFRVKIQRVVISGVPTEIDDDSILETTGASEARRISKRDASQSQSQSKKIPTTSVILGYSCPTEEVPARVQIGYLSFKTRVYIPRVTRCFKCQKFGHTAVFCRKEKDTCPVCAGTHKYTECTNKENKKCANCGQPHSASYRECPKFLASKTLVQHAAINHLSYRDALIQIRKQDRASNLGSVTTSSQPTQTSETSMSRQSTIGTQSSKKVNKDIQCNLDLDSPAVSDAGSVSAEQVTHITVDEATCSSKTNNARDSDVIKHSDLYQLLAVLMQVSEDHSISRSAIIKTILNHVFKMIDKPHDDIRQAISQYYPPATSGSIKEAAETLAKKGDHENRKKIATSKSKPDLNNSKGTKRDTTKCVQ